MFKTGQTIIFEYECTTPPVPFNSIMMKGVVLEDFIWEQKEYRPLYISIGLLRLNRNREEEEVVEYLCTKRIISIERVE